MPSWLRKRIRRGSMLGKLRGKLGLHGRDYLEGRGHGLGAVVAYDGERAGWVVRAHQDVLTGVRVDLGDGLGEAVHKGHGLLSCGVSSGVGRRLIGGCDRRRQC